LALEVIEQVRHTHPGVALREVDLVAHPEVAVKYGVRSTPAIAIDGALAWQGIPSAQALRERLEASLRRREEA
jgi:thioredoxin-like negative regulator of GroEL